MPSERRLHPYSLLFSFGAQLRAFLLPGLFVLVTAGSAGLDWQAWAMLLLIPYTLVAVARYASFRYRYEPNEMVIRTGILFRNERHVPYARIQNLDAVQNVVHRLLGVVEVRVETGGGQEPEATMSVLPLAAFEEMRRRVLAVRPAPDGLAPAAAAGPPAASGRTLLRLPPRELVLCGLVRSRGAVLVGAAFGLLWELGPLEGLVDRVLGEAASGGGLARDLLRAAAGRGGLPAGRIALAAAALAGLLLLLRLISMAWTPVRLHGYRLARDGEDLRAEYGLLTRVVATIPLRRIQSLTVREGPLHRLLGRVSVRVETAGSGEGGEAAARREQLAPIVRRSELPALLREVLPELDLSDVRWQRVHPRAFRRELKVWSAVAVVVALPFAPALGGWDLALLAVLLAGAAAGARLSVGRLGWALVPGIDGVDGALQFRSGWIRRQATVVRFGKVQAVAVHESPFDRRAGMASLRVDTAGAEGAPHRVDVPYLARATAFELCDLLALRAARTEFRW